MRGVGAKRGERSRFHYPAIDGLRAIAVLLVVLGHADVPGFGRGFIGVDMFFALSGFLITDRIVLSLRDGATQPLLSFWAARARRILPMMTCVVAVTCLVSAIVLSPQELSRIAGYGFAANVFMVNNLIAYKGGNYSAGPLRELPFLHLWPLAIEEQFYLVWPVALGVVARAVNRLVRSTYQRVIGVGLLVTIPSSLLASVILTRVSDRWAFYSLPTRVYEFALGGAAVLFLQHRQKSATARSLALLAGVVSLVLAMLFTPIGLGFPSAWPVLAAGGTVLVILGTEPTGRDVARWSPTSVLGSDPLRLIGRYSYGWYLWHWPALVLGTAVWGLGWGRVASVASIVLAIATFHLVEQPFRYRRSLVASNARSLLAGALALAVGAAACVGLAAFAHVRMEDPFIADLAHTEESFRSSGCTNDSFTLSVETCIGGSTNPKDPIVVLIGDSHAGQWVAAFSKAGEEHGFRIAVRELGNCSAIPFRTQRPDQSDECRAYQSVTELLIDDERVAAIAFSEALTSRQPHGTPADWFRAAKEASSRSPVPVGIVVDNPDLAEPLRCLARGNPADECRVARADALRGLERYRPFEQRLAAESSMRLFDLTQVACAADPCPLKYRGTWIAARAGHLNRAFTLDQTERIATFVDGLLGRDA